MQSECVRKEKEEERGRERLADMKVHQITDEERQRAREKDRERERESDRANARERQSSGEREKETEKIFVFIAPPCISPAIITFHSQARRVFD